jgi:hypothetical protein
MAANTAKKQAKQDPNAYYQQAIADGLLDNQEIAFLKQTKAGKGLINAEKNRLNDELSQGNYGALNPYITAGKTGSNMFKGVDKLNSANLQNILQSVNKANSGNINPDLSQLDPSTQGFYANIAKSLGYDNLLNDQWKAELGGKNMYLGADGNLQMTTAGQNAYKTGINSAGNLTDYQKQFVYDNYANQFYNADGSLNETGQGKFNDFWQTSGTADRAAALDKFNQQYNPIYKPTTQTGTTPTQGGGAPTVAPTNQNQLNEWSSNNLMGTTQAPLSQQNIDALKSMESTARENIASGDKYGAIRNQLMGMVSNTEKNPFIGTANPYLQAVIDATNEDITKNYNNNVMASTNATMARNNAFGGSAWQQAQDDNAHRLAKDLSTNTATMRMQDYNQQAGLWQQDQNRRLNAAGLYGNYANDSRYNDANMLMGVGDQYRNYSQGLINENLKNWQDQQNWAQQQNDRYGNAINMLAQSNNSTTTTGSGQSQQTLPGSGWGGAAGQALGAGLSAYSMFGGGGFGGGGNTGSINQGNASLNNMNNNYMNAGSFGFGNWG